MLPFGLRAGQLVSVNDVERGLQKDIVCPSCKNPLVARKGRQRTHHFAHSNGTDCPTAFQTVLHMRAKEIIAEEKHIFIPEHSVKLPGRRKPFNIINSRKIILDDVWIEKRIDKIIPDVFAKASGRELLIEIRVSHAVEASKLDLIKKMNISAIEVNLSDLHAGKYDDEILRTRLFEKHDRKKWLYSPLFTTGEELMTKIRQTCQRVSLGGDCPASDKIIIPYLSSECPRCEFYCAREGYVTWCGYIDKITDYVSLKRSAKKSNLQQNL